MDNKFNYNYKAPTEEERKEIKSIRRQYQPESEPESKIELLRRLNNKVKNGPMIISLAFGIVGCLIFGLGLTMVLEWDSILIGVLISLIGTIMMVVAYPIYSVLYNKNKIKYAPAIIKLSDELLNEEK